MSNGRESEEDHLQGSVHQHCSRPEEQFGGEVASAVLLNNDWPI